MDTPKMNFPTFGVYINLAPNAISVRNYVFLDGTAMHPAISVTFCHDIAPRAYRSTRRVRGADPGAR